MNEIDKIIIRLNTIAGWLRAGKESESIRREMYSAADKTCQELSRQISELAQNA